MIHSVRKLAARAAIAAALAVLPAQAFAADIAKLTADATAGSADAQFALGNAYLKGDGVPADPVAAAKWCRMAAEQGYAQAQVQLAMKYAHGSGVAVDQIEAEKWIVLAVRLDPHNQPLLRMLESHMTEDQVHHGNIAADQWQADHAAGAAKPAAN